MLMERRRIENGIQQEVENVLPLIRRVDAATDITNASVTGLLSGREQDPEIGQAAQERLVRLLQILAGEEDIEKRPTDG